MIEDNIRVLRQAARIGSGDNPRVDKTWCIIAGNAELVDDIAYRAIASNYKVKILFREHVILKDEFEGGMCNLAKKVLSENVTKHEPNPELSKIYKSFDTDNDGHVSDEEFQVGIEKLSELKSNTSARECNNSATLDLDSQDKEKNIG